MCQDNLQDQLMLVCLCSHFEVDCEFVHFHNLPGRHHLDLQQGNEWQVLADHLSEVRDCLLFLDELDEIAQHPLAHFHLCICLCSCSAHLQARMHVTCNWCCCLDVLSTKHSATKCMGSASKRCFHCSSSACASSSFFFSRSASSAACNT